MKILAVGFLGVILIGAVLLWLPICNEKPISFLDALFTSTTSVCVTGLITIVPKYQFTIVGKVVLLLLIQIGGLGIVACVAAFFMIMRRKITLKERIVIQTGGDGQEDTSWNTGCRGRRSGIVCNSVCAGLWTAKRNLVWCVSFCFSIL